MHTSRRGVWQIAQLNKLCCETSSTVRHQQLFKVTTLDLIVESLVGSLTHWLSSISSTP